MTDRHGMLRPFTIPVRCPFCGHQFGRATDRDWLAPRRGLEIKCSACGQFYTLENREVSATARSA